MQKARKKSSWTASKTLAVVVGALSPGLNPYDYSRMMDSPGNPVGGHREVLPQKPGFQFSWPPFVMEWPEGHRAPTAFQK